MQKLLLLLCVPLWPSWAMAGYDEAKTEYTKGNYKEAVIEFRKLAQEGNAEAQLSLGIMYISGNGVKRDYTEAEKWCHKAADQGSAPAQALLGALYEDGQGVGKDLAQAAYWYSRSAEQGNAVAQRNWGLMFLQGKGVSQDYVKSAKLFGSAAAHGDALAQVLLGSMYHEGEGVPRDYALAAEWFRKSAEQGNADAQKNLALMYSKGEGVPKDAAMAAQWMRKYDEQNRKLQAPPQAVSASKSSSKHTFVPDEERQGHCSIVVGTLGIIPMWRENGVPLSMVERNIDDVLWQQDKNIESSFTFHNIPVASRSAYIEAWDSAVASTPGDKDDWHTAVASIYRSNATSAQIQGALNKFCKPNTKHTLSPRDLDDLLTRVRRATDSEDQNRSTRDLDKNAWCGLTSSFYTQVAAIRDAGNPPETSLNVGGDYKYLSLEVRKSIINQVYFDPSFEHARGDALREQILKDCLYGPKAFKPLK